MTYKNREGLKFLIEATFAVGLLVGMLYVLLTADGSRDIVFTGQPIGCRDKVVCARELHFNGDWTGVKLCKGHTCVVFEEVIREERH